jgi:hypothetical protein
MEPFVFVPIAQLVEQQTFNLRVVGSSPTVDTQGTIVYWLGFQAFILEDRVQFPVVLLISVRPIGRTLDSGSNNHGSSP